MLAVAAAEFAQVRLEPRGMTIFFAVLGVHVVLCTVMFFLVVDVLRRLELPPLQAPPSEPGAAGAGRAPWDGLAVGSAVLGLTVWPLGIFLGVRSLKRSRGGLRLRGRGLAWFGVASGVVVGMLQVYLFARIWF